MKKIPITYHSSIYKTIKYIKLIHQKPGNYRMVVGLKWKEADK